MENDNETIFIKFIISLYILYILLYIMHYNNKIKIYLY